MSVHSLTLAAGATLEVMAASTLHGDLLLTDGTLKPLATLVLNGDTTWGSGEFAGPAEVVNRGVITIDGDATNLRSVNGPLRNEDTIVLSGSSLGSLRLNSGAHVINAAGATFEVRGSPLVNGSTDVPFDNHGLLLKSSGPGTSSWTAAAVNHLGGTVQVQVGTLGSHTVVNVLSGTYSGSGAGVVVLAGGDRFEIAGAGATFDFSGGGIEWHGSKIAGPGTLTNAGLIRIRRDGGSPSLEGSIVNLATLGLSGSQLGGLANSGGASIDNRVGATFTLFDDQGIASTSVPLTLTNGGNLTKVGGVGNSNISACFVDDGGRVDAGIVITSPAACG